MGKAIKLTSTEGVPVYVGIEDVACMFEIHAGVRMYVGHNMEVDVRGDIDDLAEMIWGNRQELPKRPSRRNEPEGTVL